MPWMPEVFTAPIAEARRAEGDARTNDAVPYYEGIRADQPDALVRSFAGEPLVNDPRVGYVEGATQLRVFASATAQWLRERDAVVVNVALTLTRSRTVEEVVLQLIGDEGGRVELPVAIVTDGNPDRTVKTVRVYHSMWPLAGEHAVRPPLLPADPELHARGVVGDYQRALAKGDLGSIVGTFEPDGYAREPSGGAYVHRGAEGLQELYAQLFANGGGIRVEHCTLTDDGARCAIEYNCVRWGVTDIPAQAGVSVYERGDSGLLAAARVYDDVSPPVVSDTSSVLLNTQGSYLAELPQQQQQNLQQLTQQAMRQAQEQQRTLQQQARSQQQNFQQVFQQTLDTFSQLFNVPASHAGESAQIAQESARIVQRAASEVPIEGYDELNVEEIIARLEGLSEEEVGRVREYERGNKNRATLLEQIDRRAAGGGASS